MQLRDEQHFAPAVVTAIKSSLALGLNEKKAKTKQNSPLFNQKNLENFSTKIFDQKNFLFDRFFDVL